MRVECFGRVPVRAATSLALWYFFLFAFFLANFSGVREEVGVHVVVDSGLIPAPGKGCCRLLPSPRVLKADTGVPLWHLSKMRFAPAFNFYFNIAFVIRALPTGEDEDRGIGIGAGCQPS